MPPPLAIDHAVIAVRDLDAAAAQFAALGFTLTPRGFHSIGSQNHCVMLGSTYVELLAALALSTEDADAAYRALRERGLAARPPMDLARPVEGGVARFRLVQLEGARSVFICEHLTRELVWRPQWQSHANGATELVGASLAANKPFDALPASIEWSAHAALRIQGLRREVEAHGVRLIPA